MGLPGKEGGRRPNAIFSKGLSLPGGFPTLLTPLSGEGDETRQGGWDLLLWTTGTKKKKKKKKHTYKTKIKTRKLQEKQNNKKGHNYIYLLLNSNENGF